MANCRELLVNGFIREIQKALSRETIIPLEVIQICVTFYSVNTKIFYIARLSSYYGLTSSYIYMVNGELIRTLKIPEYPSENLQMIAGCYIPDISSVLNTKNAKLDCNKQYDGIVTVSSVGASYDEFVNFSLQSVDPQYLNITLFERNAIYDKKMIFHSVRSQTAIHDIHRMSSCRLKYCHDINMLYFCNNDGLHQLILKDHDLIPANFQFNTISSDTNIINDSNASVQYIDGHNKIFGIGSQDRTPLYCYGDIDIYDDYGNKAQQIINKETKCGIFDLDKKQWIGMNSLQHSVYSRMLWSAEICDNNVYDPNKQYIVSNIGQTLYMDLHKNKWNVMIDELIPPNKASKCIVWMEKNPFIIYSSDYDNHRYLDVRNNKYKWIKHDEIYHTISMLTERNTQSAYCFFV